MEKTMTKIDTPRPLKFVFFLFLLTVIGACGQKAEEAAQASGPIPETVTISGTVE